MKFLPILLLISISALGQEEKKTMEPINLLFEGMKKGDSALTHRAFHPSIRMFTVFTDKKTNQPILKADDVAGFLKAIGTPHKETWNELIWSPKIEIDGNFAQVWAPYGFYVDKTFHHCGVDAFHLFKNAAGEWKIFHLADTRNTEGCKVPDEVSNQLK